ncbi:tyrosinase-like protein 2 [Saccostrea echinata]|uniref:tyrosinase-like protein 2 n=1 Tax=Saccostrea echinata TaxID=191078 RepID=UPI002A8319CA|nr:tyrosinase-like protein 2 [Saccostrea echinata]
MSDTQHTRKEIRTLGETERQEYIDAVLALKKDTTIWPNKYDAIAMIHTNQTICSIHRGSNFLGWHRVFLLIFESALRQKNKKVALPYWDSLLDNYMDNNPTPSESIIFTNEFLGNGKGIVRTGPFKFWKDVNNCTLRRNLNFNNSGTLMTHSTIDMIMNDLSVHHMKQIVYNKENNTHTLEGQHNIVHDWVGGMMSILDDSPRDPVFFLHHAYIDYIWSKFIQKQTAMKVEEEYEIVGDDIKRHYPNRTMDCFYWMRNVDGLKASLAANVRYEDSPTCPDCGQSKYLKCDRNLNRCVPSDKFTTAGKDSVHMTFFTPILFSLFLYFISLLI